MNDDSQLLRHYIEHRAEAAFTELVQRHIHLVYFSALRRVGGDAHLADDVTQRVFADLARKAESLKGRSAITGWLYTSTRFAAAQAVRSERRRKSHEQDAQVMQELHSDQTAIPDWDQLRPMIDSALDDLNERDREAVLLRYFENCSFAEVAEHFSVTPDAARMRVDRALEKLRGALARKGVVSTSAALGAAFAVPIATATPAGLTQQVVGFALSQTLPAAAVSTAALLKVGAVLTVVSLGIGLTYFGLKHIRAQTSDSPPSVSAASAATNAQEHKLNTAAESNAVGRNSTAPARVATEGSHAPQAAIRRTTDAFGWPRVGLFAADSGGKPNHTLVEFRAKMRSNSEFREVVVAQAKENLDQIYGRLFRTLQLAPPQLEVFKNLLVEKERLHIDVAEAQNGGGAAGTRDRGMLRAEIEQAQQGIDSEIKAALGDSGYIAYLSYREDLVQWTTIEAVVRKLEGSATPLTDYQINRLLILLRSALIRIRPPYTFDLVYGAGVFPPHIGAGLTPQVLKNAEDFLSPPQLQALRELKRTPLSAGDPGAQ